VGVSQGIHITQDWEARGVNRLYDGRSIREELAFLSAPNPHHEQFVSARRLLELDLVAFDYSYDREGRIVVWEANPYPNMSYPTHPDRQYAREGCDRSYAAMLLLYLHRAGLEIPTGLREFAVGKTPWIDQAA
jgi:hypothetical protein